MIFYAAAAVLFGGSVFAAVAWARRAKPSVGERLGAWVDKHNEPQKSDPTIDADTAESQVDDD